MKLTEPDLYPLKTGYMFDPCKKGEEFRECANCGYEFKPTTRNQKYCVDCKDKVKKARDRKRCGCD